MKASNNLNHLGQVLSRKSPAILTAVGVTGTITTAYLASKATWHAHSVIIQEKQNDGVIDDPVEAFKEYAPLVWRLYIPTVVVGLGTCSAILLASRVESRRTAAAVSAYSLTERAFSEYKAKVVEEVGKHKEQVFRDDIVRKKVDEKSPDGAVVVMGSGEVICCELYTHRYFMSDMESLRKAQNDVNVGVLSDLYVTLEEFYHLVGLDNTSHSGELGWDEGKPMELEFSTVLTKDGKPCLAFNYNYIKPI